jgi:hypothetical protein
MYQFADWAEEIAEVSTLPEFMNATVVIYTPGGVGEYDPDTNTYETGDPVLHYNGRARVVGVRSARDDIQAGNPSTLKSVRLQVPREGIPGPIPDQARAYFTDGGRNPILTQYIFTVNSDFNSSHVAAYTLELTVAMDITDADPPAFEED